MDKVRKLVASGIAPKGAHNNLEFVSNSIAFPMNFLKEDRLILSDPQTSGGLLIALPKTGLHKFERNAQKEKMPFWIIGEVVKGKGRIVVK